MSDDIRILTNGNLCPITYAEIIKACNGAVFSMSLTGRDAVVAAKAANAGIDSRLQACFMEDDCYEPGKRVLKSDDDETGMEISEELVLARTLECEVSPESLPVLIRRLFDDMVYTGKDGDDADVGNSLAEGILQSLGFDDCGTFVGRDD